MTEIFEIRTAPEYAARGLRWSLYHVPSSSHLFFYATKKEARFVADALVQRYGDALDVPTMDDLTKVIPAADMFDIWKAKERHMGRSSNPVHDADAATTVSRLKMRLLR